jgi:hypothetical protein
MLTAIVAVTLTVPDLPAAQHAYSHWLSYRVVEQGLVAPETALAWGAPLAEGRQYSLLQPASGEPVYLRLVQSAPTPGFAPMKTHGWNSNEILVQDPDALALQFAAADSPFRVIGPPRPLASSSKVRAMQAIGPAGELNYFTRIPPEGGMFIKTPAKSAVDRTFIVVMGGPSMPAMREFYSDSLGMTVTDSYRTTVNVLQEAWNLPVDQQFTLALVPISPAFLIELDRRRHAGLREQCGHCLLQQALPFLQPCRVAAGFDRGDLVANESLDTRLDPRAQPLRRLRRNMPQPVVASRQQLCEQSLQALPVVADAFQPEAGEPLQRGVLFSMAQRQPRSPRVQRLGVVGRFDAAAEAGCDRQRRGKPLVQRIQCLDAQSTWIVLQLPTALLRPLERRVCECLVACLERIARRLTDLQRSHDPRAHLASRLAGKRDGEDLLGCVDHCQQSQEALYQHGGLAGPGGRLQQHGARRIRRQLAHAAVVLRRIQWRLSHSASSLGSSPSSPPASSSSTATTCSARRHSSVRSQLRQTAGAGSTVASPAAMRSPSHAR